MAETIRGTPPTGLTERGLRFVTQTAKKAWGSLTADEKKKKKKKRRLEASEKHPVGYAIRKTRAEQKRQIEGAFD